MQNTRDRVNFPVPPFGNGLTLQHRPNTMNRFLQPLAIVAMAGAAFVAAAPSASAQTKDWGSFQPSASYEILDAMLEDSADDVVRVGARPPILARQMAIVATAMYDAWAAYDERAVGVYTGGKLRRPAAERTEDNKRKAMAYAAYRTTRDQFPVTTKNITALMQKWGYDVADLSMDLATPTGIGNYAAQQILAMRHHDGSNQLGDEVGSNGKPYSDYTFYFTVNPPNEIYNPDRWQQIPFDDGKGGKFTPNFLCAHWYRVVPFGLESPSQFRPGPPPKVGSEQLKKEVDECINFNATLTPEQKAIVEFMRDGPRSTGQSGHWLRFAQAVSRRDHNNLDTDVKMYMAVANTAMDAFIASWECKRFYDSSRPWTLIHYYYKGKDIDGWTGPGKGVAKIKGENWIPYSPSTFVTPPFPGYPSGHSTVSAGCAKMLELFTGSDRFGDEEQRTAGAITEQGFDCKAMQAVHGKMDADDKLTCDVALRLPTFSAVAEMAGISRVMGGYHIQSDNVEGLKMGRSVAQYLWPKCQAYFNGTAK